MAKKSAPKTKQENLLPLLLILLSASVLLLIVVLSQAPAAASRPTLRNTVSPTRTTPPTAKPLPKTK